MESFVSESPAETMEIAGKLAERLCPGDAVLYRGEMGAGKTWFTKGIARHFGAEGQVTSPTFALVNEYEGRVDIFHFDLYRIDSFDDLYAIGFFDYLDRDGIFCVEWSENLPELFDYFQSAYTVSINKTGDEQREITIEKVK